MPIHFVGDHDGTPFLVMPLLKGGPLSAHLRRGRMPVSDVVLLGRQAASGLAAAHDAGLIHRDIKPDNLWLAPPGDTFDDPFRVLLLDFGPARGGDAGTLTQTGAVMGTPGYMAPGQAGGVELDARADLFSLGCVLYEAATGGRPFGGGNLFAYASALVSTTPAAARVANAAVPEELSALIGELLAKEPGGWPATAREVARRLAAISRSGSGAITLLSVPTVAVQEPTPAPPTPPGHSLKTTHVQQPAIVNAKAGVKMDEEPPPLPPRGQPVIPIPISKPAPPRIAPKRPPLMDSTVRGLEAGDVKALQREWAEYLGVPVEVTDDPGTSVTIAFAFNPARGVVALATGHLWTAG